MAGKSPKEPEAGEVLGSPKSEAKKLSAEFKKAETEQAAYGRDPETGLTPHPEKGDVHSVGVVFQKPWKRYYPGDKAGFPPQLASKLVAMGVATKPSKVAEVAKKAAGVIKGKGKR